MLISRSGQVDFFHYDILSLVALADIEDYYARSEAELVRYPAIDGAAFDQKIRVRGR